MSCLFFSCEGLNSAFGAFVTALSFFFLHIISHMGGVLLRALARDTEGVWAMEVSRGDAPWMGFATGTSTHDQGDLAWDGGLIGALRRELS